MLIRAERGVRNKRGETVILKRRVIWFLKNHITQHCLSKMLEKKKSFHGYLEIVRYPKTGPTYSACRWSIVENTKIFWSYIKLFLNLPRVENIES